MDYLTLVPIPFYEAGTFIAHVLQIMRLSLRVIMKPGEDSIPRPGVQTCLHKGWSQNVDPDEATSIQVHTASL